MQEVPGIYFATEAGGREAKVQGTGLAVWEVVRLYRAFGGDMQALHDAYPHLTPAGIRAALRYAELYRDEVEAAIREAEELSDPELLRKRCPELADRIVIL